MNCTISIGLGFLAFPISDSYTYLSFYILCNKRINGAEKVIIQHPSINHQVNFFIGTNYQVNLQSSRKFIFALKRQGIDVKTMLASAYF